MNNQSPQQNNTTKSWLRYVGMGSQLLAYIGLSVFVGYKADKWLNIYPLLTCALPLLALSVFFYKLIRETAVKGKSKRVGKGKNEINMEEISQNNKIDE